MMQQANPYAERLDEYTEAITEDQDRVHCARCRKIMTLGEYVDGTCCRECAA